MGPLLGHDDCDVIHDHPIMVIFLIVMLLCDCHVFGLIFYHDVFCDFLAIGIFLDRDVVFYQLVLGLHSNCDCLTLNLFLHYDVVYDFPILNFFSFVFKV